MGVLRRPAFLVIAALPVVLGCSSHEDDGPPGPAIYVGSVDGTDMRVGLVTENGAGALFFCGGPKTLPNTKWFRPTTLDPNKFDIVSKDGTSRANGQPDGSGESGWVKFGTDDEIAWHVVPVPAGSVAGLYDYKGADGVGGVVVVSGDTTQGAFIDPAPAFKVESIIVIRPVELVDGEKLHVTIGDSARPIEVARVHPSPN